MPTNIEWTDESWNPGVGCTKVSLGCLNCYAEKMAYRLACIGHKKYQHIISTDGGVWNNKVYCDNAAIDKPLHWKKPRRIFVCSMGDLFHESVPFEFINKVSLVMARCPQHTFQVLTKRPEIALEHTKNWQKESGYPSLFSNNVWLGVTAENQEWADKRIPILLQIPAAVRFVSLEPLLEGILLEMFEGNRGSVYKCLKCGWKGSDKDLTGDNLSINCPMCNARNTLGANHKDELEKVECYPSLDWVIVGCESGPNRRPCEIEWMIDIVQQCQSASVPVFVKQIPINGKVNKNLAEWPEELQIHEYPAKKAKHKEILYVSICEAKPNKLFTEEQRQSIRFLIYNKRVKCAECGKKAKKMWTMLCQFKAANLGSIHVEESEKSHLPLTPVCDKHPLGPDFEE